MLYNINDATNYDVPFFFKYPGTASNAGNPGASVYQPKTIVGFRLRDEKGTIYEFGYLYDAIEYTTDFFRMSDKEVCRSWIAKSWYLKKVYDKFENVLYELTYEQGCFIPQVYRYYEYESVNTQTGPYGPWYDPLSWFGSLNSYRESFDGQFPFKCQLDAPVYLTQIHGMDGSFVNFTSEYLDIDTKNFYPGLISAYASDYDVRNAFINNAHIEYEQYPFYYLESPSDVNSNLCRYPHDSSDQHPFAATRLKKLTNIEFISQITSHSQLKIDYSLSYSFNSRMHLVEVSESGVDTPVRKHNLSYYNYDQLPSDYLTSEVDHWGYYNGRAIDYLNYNINYSTYKSLREPDAAKMQYGSLTKIVYPTGGCSVFEYEPNSYYAKLSADRQSLLPENGIGGGLRVKSISEYEDSTCSTLLTKRTFNYNKPGTTNSSGQLFASPIYYWANWEPISENGTATVTTFRSSSIVPLSNSFGPAVGYTYVEERNHDDSSILRHYQNLNTAGYADGQFVKTFCGSSPSPFDKFSERGYRRGRLLSETYYKNTEKVFSRTYTYRSDDMESDFVYAANFIWCPVLLDLIVEYYAGGVYKIFFPKYDVRTVCDSTFSNGSLILVESQKYGKRDVTLNMIRPYVHSSKVRLLDADTIQRGYFSQVNKYFYPSTPPGDYADSLIAEDFELYPEMTYTYRNNKFVEASKTVFQRYSVNLEPHVLPKYYIVGYPALTDTLYKYDSYTFTGALSQYTKLGEPQTNLIWKYNDCYLVAKIMGNMSTSFPSISDSYALKTNNLAGALNSVNANNSVLFTGYTYDPLCGVTGIINPNLTRTIYTYNSSGWLKDIQNYNGQLLKSFEYNYRNK